MGKFIQVADVNDLSEGTMKKYLVQETEILIAKIAGKYYATQNKCPHFGGDLSGGKLEGDIVTCPRHGSQFNLTNGNMLRWMKGKGLVSSIGKVLKPPRNLVTFPVKVERQSILVEI